MLQQVETRKAGEANDLNIDPKRTPIYIGVGVTNEGKITLANSDPALELRVVVAGSHIGDIHAPVDIVQVVRGGSLKPTEAVRCRHLVIAGRLISPDAEIFADKVSLLASAVVSVRTVHAKSVEQQMGCRLNGQVNMGDVEQEVSEFDEKPQSTGGEATAQAAQYKSSFPDDPAGTNTALDGDLPVTIIAAQPSNE